MPLDAPRLPARLWHAIVRGAALMLVLGAGQTAASDPIVSARYDGPTTWYPHAVLGDAIEHDTLEVRLASGKVLRATYPKSIVFEDTAPRIVDLDRDQEPEVIVVESHQDKGARLAVWAVQDGELALLVETPFIGTRFRWLAPIGAADLDGDGLTEIAYVDRPHLTKTLRVWRFERMGKTAELTEVASKSGLTNHRIGEDFITGGIRDCGTDHEIVTADANWRSVMVTRLQNGALMSRRVGPYESPASVTEALACER